MDKERRYTELNKNESDEVSDEETNEKKNITIQQYKKFDNIINEIIKEYINNNKLYKKDDKNGFKEFNAPFYFADFNDTIGKGLLMPGTENNYNESINSIEKQTKYNNDPTKFSVDIHQITESPYISLFDTKLIFGDSTLCFSKFSKNSTGCWWTF